MQKVFKLYENDDKIINVLEKINYWYNEAADNDNKVALYKLGEFYKVGKGVCKNLVRAFEFFKKSANCGCLEAQYKVGYYYDNGIVVGVDKERAFELYKITAEKGSGDAQKSLTYLCEQGEGTKKNMVNTIY